jgi:hypothetical protein
MPDVELLPQTAEQAQVATLAFAGIVGGGLVAYEVARAIRDGDLFATDAYPPNYEVGTVAMIGGLGMFAMMVKEAVAEVGWKPLLAGSAGIVGLVFVVRAARR